MIRILALLIGYLIGGIPTGIWITRAVKGVDPRSLGSGSSGATNVSRVLGTKWAVVVLILDALKGFLPVFFIAPLLPAGDQMSPVQVAVALGTVIGHVFTPYAKFRGGKGVATGAGAMLALDPMAVGIALAVWLFVFLPFRRVSIASLFAAITVPVAMVLLRNRPPEQLGAAVFLLVFLIYTHRENIQRLLSGHEQSIL
jgi:glycerol-3-phosphate acyltransferase PlsY